QYERGLLPLVCTSELPPLFRAPGLEIEVDRPLRVLLTRRTRLCIRNLLALHQHRLKDVLLPVVLATGHQRAVRIRIAAQRVALIAAELLRRLLQNVRVRALPGFLELADLLSPFIG